jgi:hypothetical protein
MSESGVAYLGDAAEDVGAHSIRDGGVTGSCYYCGETATCIDHVVPRAMLETLATLEDDYVSDVLARFGRRMTVPSCRECNAILSSSYQDSLAKRKAECKRRLRARHRKLLAMPDWSEAELRELGSKLRSQVVRSLALRDIVRLRLAH